MSQLSDFIAAAQSGHEMSLESLRPCLLVFGDTEVTGTAGTLQKDLEPQNDGTMLEIYTRRFRVRLSLLTAAEITIAERKTQFTVDGRAYRVEKTFHHPPDPCLLLQCKQI